MTTRDSGRLPLWLAGLLLFLCVAGCGGLPEYARPRFISPDELEAGGGNSFGYRLLAVSDFQATSPPEPSGRYNHRIQARSCISLGPSAETMARIVLGTVADQQVYMGRFFRLSFQAYFNPGCSWFSPKIQPERVPYVLQHEQIHFALAELTARRLNREARRELEQYLAFGNDPREVQAQLEAKAKSIAREVMEQEIGVQTGFDEDTSLYFDPPAQQKWFDEIERRLRETSWQ